jgi:lathosterol oxidase
MKDMPPAARPRDLRQLARILGFLKPYRARLACALIALVVAATGVLVIGQGLRHVIDRGFAAADPALLDRILLSLLAVFCFHFPDLLTSRELRAVYTEQFARSLLLAGLVAAFVLGTLAIVRGRQRRTALVGVASATLAVALGGTGIGFGPIRPTPWSLGLDWFVLSLLLTALVFVPLERLYAQRPQSPLR